MSQLIPFPILMKSALASLLMLGMAGCSAYNSDWPSLTDSPERAESRERVIEAIDVPSYEAPPSAPPATIMEARERLAAIEQDIKNDRTIFEDQLAAYETLETEAKTDAWFALQVALTRLSHTMSRLDPVIDLLQTYNPAGFESVAQNASDIKANLNSFVIEARQKLISLEPTG